MPSAAQTQANRQNAQASTGPRTEAGKARSAQNATKLGLFSQRNFVLPEEEAEYDALRLSLWERLNPADSIEGVYAMEVIRAAWRLRRCANVEGNLAEFAGRREHAAANAARPEEDSDKDRGDTVAPKQRFYDSMEHGYTRPTQIAVDRARTQALGTLNRAMAELRRLQNERRLRIETLPANLQPGNPDYPDLGISDSAAIAVGIAKTVHAREERGRASACEAQNAFLEATAVPLPALMPERLTPERPMPERPMPERSCAPETKETQPPPAPPSVPSSTNWPDAAIEMPRSAAA